MLVYREEIFCDVVLSNTFKNPELKIYWCHQRLSHLSLILWINEIICLPSFAVGYINWIDTLAVNDVTLRKSLQIFHSRPDEPEIKNVFKLVHCFYILKTSFDTSDGIVNELCLMTTLVAWHCKSFVGNPLLLLISSKISLYELVKCFVTLSIKFQFLGRTVFDFASWYRSKFASNKFPYCHLFHILQQVLCTSYLVFLLPSSPCLSCMCQITITATWWFTCFNIRDWNIKSWLFKDFQLRLQEMWIVTGFKF